MNRYELEHVEIPMQFYRSCRELMSSLEREGAGSLARLYGQIGEFALEEFDAGLLETEGAQRIYRAFVPGASMPAECVILYMIYTENYEPQRFLTVEISPEGGHELFGWDEHLGYMSYGRFDGRNERRTLENVLEQLSAPEEKMDAGRFGQMRELLQQFELPFYEDEVTDYIQMFDVIGELIEEVLTVPERVATFAAMSQIMKDGSIVTARDKMRAMYDRMDHFPASCGKMDRKAKLFFGFSVYAAHNVISENDGKKHHLFGIAEFESAEYIKYRMEEYWSMDPYMFSFAFN